MLWTKGRSDNGRRCQADANHCFACSFDMNILAIKKRLLQRGDTFELHLYCTRLWINFLLYVNDFCIAR